MLSMTGSASISARRTTVGPSPWRITPMTPVPPKRKLPGPDPGSSGCARDCIRVATGDDV